MIEQIIKKMLRKWLKKKVFIYGQPLRVNVIYFNWVYKAPLQQWKDRVWVTRHCPCTGEEGLSRMLSDYLYL